MFELTPEEKEQRAADLATLTNAAQEAAGHPFIPAPVREAMGAVVRLVHGVAADLAALRAAVDKCQDCGATQGGALEAPAPETPAPAPADPNTTGQG